jgi:hypothetical protein
VRIEDVDNLGEIGERPCQPIDFVDNDDLNLAGLDVLQKPVDLPALCGAVPARA